MTRGSNQFQVSFAKGADQATRFVLIATGVTDHLPAIPGFKQRYGRSVFHCPYCDGWEWRDMSPRGIGARRRRSASRTRAQGGSADVLLCTQGSAMKRSLKDSLARNRIAIRTERVLGLDHHRGALSAIRFAKGDPARRDALFFTTAQHLHSNLAIRLGCKLTHRGTVKTGMLCVTNIPGVFVVATLHAMLNSSSSPRRKA